MPTISAVLAALAQAECPVLIIGANALEAHGYARFTVDVDCLIAATSLEQLKAALARHGFMHAGSMTSFHEFWFEGKPGGMPVHAMFVDDSTFQKMWERSVPCSLSGSPLRAPCVAHLVALKLHAVKNNPKRLHKDIEDVRRLLEQNAGAVSPSELAEISARYASADAVAVLKSEGFL